MVIFTSLRNARGFSLVELSIVLVILGLLVGGILSGRSLINAAELRKITTEHDRYLAATLSFRDKYFMLPGDMNNATQFWGIAGGTGSNAACRTTISTDVKTCNGNGDNMVTAYVGSYEYTRFWQHLAAAGLIEGSYSGSSAHTAASVPKNKMRNSFWTAYYWGDCTSGSCPSMFDASYGHAIGLGIASGVDLPIPLTPQEAWNIDSKTDDGKPGTGKLLAACPTAAMSACTDAVDSTGAATANYLVSSTDVTAALLYRQQF